MADQTPLGSPDVFEVAVPVATVWTSPEAPRSLDMPAVLDEPDVATWTAAMSAEVRKGLDGRTLTQLLLGEAVLVLEHRGEWVRVAAPAQGSSRHPRGYPGWVRRAHLASPVPRTRGAAAFVITPTGVCTLDDGTKTELSFGTALWVSGVGDDTAEVLLPGGRTGTLAWESLRLAHRGQQQAYGPDDLLDTARQFLGLRYLWGGTSAWGLDCSGLVHLTYRAHGVRVARDACDQAEQVVPVALGEVEPGDLYFFARPGQRVYHVGFATSPLLADGTRWMLHAPESGELVEDAPMAPPRYEHLVAAGRVRKPDAGQLPRELSGR